MVLAIKILLIIAFLLTALNEFYFHIVLGLQQEQHILKAQKSKYDMIAFGSAYCRHGIDFPEACHGYNFGIVSEFFYYTDKMLREYAPKCLKQNGIVYLIIADLVFARVGKGIYGSERYSILLSKKSLGEEFALKDYLKFRFPLLVNPKKGLFLIAHYIIKGSKRNGYYQYYMMEHNQYDYKKCVEAAKARCTSWCRQFGTQDTVSGEIPQSLSEQFALTRPFLTGMIDFCLKNGYRPVLVVTPVSKVMNECIGDDYIKKVLYDNIEQANVQKVPFLDYLRDERFSDISLYSNNADCLNARGRRMFTEVLVSDTKKIFKA